MNPSEKKTQKKSQFHVVFSIRFLGYLSAHKNKKAKAFADNPLPSLKTGNGANLFLTFSSKDGERNMIIYAFDERWPNKNYAMTPHHERLAPYGGFIRKFIFNKHWDIQSVVNAIEIACDVNGSAIELLRICAHGNSGMVKIGKGLDINNVNQFRSLKGKFESLNSSGKGIEIHACGVASSTNIWNSKKQQCVGGSIGVPAKGLLFINALAKAADTKVVAGINCQYTDNQFHFEIPWTAAYP